MTPLDERAGYRVPSSSSGPARFGQKTLRDGNLVALTPLVANTLRHDHPAEFASTERTKSIAVNRPGIAMPLERA